MSSIRDICLEGENSNLLSQGLHLNPSSYSKAVLFRLHPRPVTALLSDCVHLSCVYFVSVCPFPSYANKDLRSLAMRFLFASSRSLARSVFSQ